MTNLDPSKTKKNRHASKDIFTTTELKALRSAVINSGDSRHINILELLYTGLRLHEIVNSTTKELSSLFPEWLAAAGLDPKGRTLHNLRVSVAHQLAKSQTHIPHTAIIALTKYHQTKQISIHYTKSKASMLPDTLSKKAT